MSSASLLSSFSEPQTNIRNITNEFELEVVTSGYVFCTGEKEKQHSEDSEGEFSWHSIKSMYCLMASVLCSKGEMGH